MEVGALACATLAAACACGRIRSALNDTSPASASPPVLASTPLSTPLASGTDAGVAAILPADRVTIWNPGLRSVGGIPNRTTICATIRPSGGDDTALIQGALDSCPPNQVVQLEAGTFSITGNGLAIGRSNVVLRGRGPDKTRLVKPKGTNFPVIILGRRWPKYTQPTDLAEGGVKGKYTIKLTHDPGLKANEIVLVDQLTNDALTYWGPNAPPKGPQRGWFCRYDRPIGQVLEVARVDGNTITFTTPLHIDFPKGSSPQLVRFSADPDGPPIDAVRYSGVEDLYVGHGEGGDGGGNIHLFVTAYSWVKNVESDASQGQGVNFDGAFRSELRDSYIHSTIDPNPGGAGYGVGINSYAADNLVENNAIWNFNKVDCFRASGGGNVFGYNYLEDGFGAGYPTIVEVGLNASHYTTPHFELFEGNEAFNFDSDSFWGNSIYITVFRNHFTAKRRSLPPVSVKDEMNRRAIGLTHHHYWYNFVANILGTEGQTPGSGNSFVYETNEHFGDWKKIPMWQLGYDGSKWSPPQDTKVVSTMLRHGNFDYVTNQAVWDPRLPRKLPPSFYLTDKPPFLGDAPWPVMDPERTPKVGLLPARKRFDAGRK